jgi:hypothetical protein
LIQSVSLPKAVLLDFEGTIAEGSFKKRNKAEGGDKTSTFKGFMGVEEQIGYQVVGRPRTIVEQSSWANRVQ